MIKKVINVAKFLSGSFIFLNFTNSFIIGVYKVDEVYHMTPSFNPKIKNSNDLTWLNCDYVLVWKFKMKVSGVYHSNSLVYMHHPMKKDTRVIRYISATRHDWIKAKNFEMYYNVPHGRCWVDCLKGDDDSHEWGFVPNALLIGRPILLIRPFRKLIPVYKVEHKIKDKLHIDQRVISDQMFNF